MDEILEIPRRLKCWLGPFDGRSYEMPEGSWPVAIFIPFPVGITHLPARGDFMNEQGVRCAKYVPQLRTSNPDSWVLAFRGYEEM
jgi:hypothetical protein